MHVYSKIANHIDDFTNQIQHAANTLGIGMTQTQLTQLLWYLDGLLLWNKAYNLTAINHPTEALIKHIFDCMAIVPDLPFNTQSNIKLLDVGTGAGLPSVILAILKPDWQIDALDSNGKKIRFIRQMVSELNIKNLTPFATRIEQHHLTNHYDVVTSRAFASLLDFVNLTHPYLNQVGMLYAMKGKQPTAQELASLPNWSITTKKITVPWLHDERCVVYLKQNTPT